MITPHLIAMFAAARTVAAGPPPPAAPAGVLAHFDGSLANSVTGPGMQFLNTYRTDVAKFGTHSYRGTINAAGTIGIGTGDFVFDVWVYGGRFVFLMNPNSYDFELEVRASVGFAPTLTRYNDLGDPVYDVTGAAPLPSGWCHVEVSRVSGAVRLFVDGVLSASAADSSNLTADHCNFRATDALSAMDEARLTIGAGGHTANFTPPTAPYANGTASLFLLHLDGNVTNNGTGAPSLTAEQGTLGTTTVKFGSGSLNGSAVVPWADELAGDFVADMWFTASAGSFNFGSIDLGGVVQVFATEGASTSLEVNGVEVGSSVSVIPVAGWNHLELSRVSGAVRVFVNGVLATSASYATSFTPSYLQCSSISQVDEWRVVNGAGGHTSNFTPPTAPYA